MRASRPATVSSLSSIAVRNASVDASSRAAAGVEGRMPTSDPGATSMTRPSGARHTNAAGAAEDARTASTSSAPPVCVSSMGTA
ncbi:hypothetical protein ACFPRL_14030 [Pseudoclavibacter helvolus]